MHYVATCVVCACKGMCFGPGVWCDMYVDSQQLHDKFFYINFFAAEHLLLQMMTVE